MKYLMLFSSVTNVIKAQKALKEYKISSIIGRARDDIASECGCAYSLEASTGDISLLKEAFDKAHIVSKRTYALVGGRLMGVEM